MHKLLVTLATLFLLGGCIAYPTTAAPIYTTTLETTVTAITIGDSPALNINTTINESITNQTTKGPARFRFYAAWISNYKPKMGGGSSAGGKW